jgi:hypothetical protein
VRSDCTEGCSGVQGDQGTFVAFSSATDGRNQALATANAGLGFIRAFVSVSIQDDPDDRVGFVSGTAEGEFSDSFVIDGGPLNGTDGSMDFLIAIGGGGVSASASNDLTIRPFPAASASHRTRVSLDASCSGCELFVELYGDDSGSGDPRGSIVDTFDFVFGQPITLFVEGISAASAQGEGFASADFANTIEWGGFSEIRDATGNPVTNFTIVGDSGVDWSKPIEAPEPSSLLMALTGAAFLALGARLRSRTDGPE